MTDQGLRAYLSTLRPNELAVLVRRFESTSISQERHTMAKRSITKSDTKGKKPKDEEVEEEEEDHGTKDLGLEELEEMWENAEAPSFEKVPDDSYQCQIVKAVREKDKAKGGWKVTFSLKIVSGEFKGRVLNKRDNLDTEDRIGYFKGGMARLGIEVKKFADLKGQLEELLDSYCEVAAKTKDGSEYQNYYFNKALDTDDLDDQVDEDAEEETEEEEEVEVPKATKGKRSKPAPEPEEDEIDDDEESEEESEESDDDESEESEDAEEEEAEEEDEAEEEEPEPAPAKKGKKAPVEEEGVTIKFDEKEAAKLKKEISAACKVAELDPADYKNVSDMLADTAEVYGISGVWKKASDLLAETVKQAKKASK